MLKIAFREPAIGPGTSGISLVTLSALAFLPMVDFRSTGLVGGWGSALQTAPASHGWV